MFIYIGNFLLRSVARLKTESLYQSLASMKKEMYTEKYIATWICIIHVLLPRQVPCSIEPATVSAGPLKHCINAIFNCLVGQQPNCCMQHGVSDLHYFFKYPITHHAIQRTVLFALCVALVLLKLHVIIYRYMYPSISIL